MRKTLLIVLSLMIMSSSYAQGLNTFSALKDFIESNDIKTIDDLIEKLPSEMKSKPVFVYDSKSIQQSSFDTPRVILSSSKVIDTKNNSLFLAYTGNPKFRGGNTVEVMEYHGDEARFSFREIDFNFGVKYSKENPQKCLICHQSTDRTDIDPRPNWEPYSNWPGVYGKDGGFFNDLKYYQRTEIMRADGRKEYKEYENFKLKQAQNKRYKTLTFDKRNASQESLSNSLGLRNIERIKRIIKTDKKVPEVFFEVAHFLSRCKTNPNGMSFSDLRNRLKLPFSERYAEIIPRTNLKETNYTGGTTGLILDYFLTPLGLPVEDHSMTFGTFGSMGFEGDWLVTPSFFPHEVFYFPKDEVSLKDCEALANDLLGNEEFKKFKTQIKDYYDNAPYPEHKEAKAIFKRQCMKCHVDGTEGPIIPFFNTDLLKQDEYLSSEIIRRIQTTDPHLKMPLSGELTEDETHSIIKYLRTTPND